MQRAREPRGGATRHALVSFVLAWTLFGLGYGAGFGLLVLSAFAAHGGLSLSYLSQGGAIGILLGGALGLLRLFGADRRSGPLARRRTAAAVWLLWSGAGVLLCLGVDLDTLSRRQGSGTATLLLPGLTLGASVAGALLLRRTLRAERPSGG